MCLTVNMDFHDGQEILKPLTAPYDIMVWKILCKNPFLNEYYTPYMCLYVGNGMGTRKITSDIIPEGRLPLYSQQDRIVVEVKKGVHSFVINDGYYFLSTLKNLENSRPTSFPAIIPEGAKFFIGTNDDIVSNELKIFFDKKQLPKDCKSIYKFIYEHNNNNP